jgi:hypothetical protein
MLRNNHFSKSSRIFLSIKKAMKILGYLVGSVVLLLAACLAYFHFKGIPCSSRRHSLKDRF